MRVLTAVTIEISVMFFALSLIFAFIVLYFLIYSKSDSNAHYNSNIQDEIKIESDILESASSFDLDTFLMPDELYIFTQKEVAK